MDELSYEILTDPSVLWGRGSAYAVQQTEIGDLAWQVQDEPQPLEDGTAFGVDYLGGLQFTWSLTCRGTDPANTLALLAALRKAWLADAVRSSPGAVVPLRLRYAGGVDKRIYGRPRKLTPVLGKVSQKTLPVVMDFQAYDHRFYAETAGSVGLTILPPLSGGFSFPATFPLPTDPETGIGGDGIQAGDLDAWPVITFSGPVTNPSCTVGGLWTLALTGTIDAGTSVTVDTQPWARTVLRSDGASVAGALTRTTPPLSRLALPPGPFNISYAGVDPTGTSSMSFGWRDAFSSI